MDEPKPTSQRRTRIFLVVFFGAALLFALLNIYATWTADPVRVPPPASAP